MRGASAAVTLALLVAGCADDEEARPKPTTTTTEAGSTSTSTSTSPTTTTMPSADEAEALARRFAVEVLGFTAPLVGEYQAGDSRSGEVPVRPRQRGPVTTVLVRDGVLGAVTPQIRLDRPAAGATVPSPLELAGEAWAFEGTVDVLVRADGVAEPLGRTFVTGGGDQLRPFQGRVSFDPGPATTGWLVLRTESAEDGSVWEAMAIPVRFR